MFIFKWLLALPSLAYRSIFCEVSLGKLQYLHGQWYNGYMLPIFVRILKTKRYHGCFLFELLTSTFNDLTYIHFMDYLSFDYSDTMLSSVSSFTYLHYGNCEILLKKNVVPIYH